MSEREARWVAAGAAAWGAALLFVVQPMVARAVLPGFGGSPAVWTTALLFFQGVLLLGYGYAHWVAGRRGVVGVHCGVMVASLGVLPVAPVVPVGAGAEPVGALLWVLLGSVGVPFGVLAATAPLLQARAVGGEPYRLYAWSNVGSLVGLVGYPLVVEPFVGVAAQGVLWSWGYVGFVGVMGAALWGSRGVVRGVAVGRGPGVGVRGLWVGLSAAGVGVLMGVSEAIGEDLTVTPLLWVLPLGVFLLSFVVAFGQGRWAARGVWFPLAGLGVVGWVALMWAGWRAPWGVQLLGYCGGLFAVCMALHGELWRLRPEPARLTGFYLWVAGGGALGGVLVAVVGPVVFPVRVELGVAVLVGYGLLAVAVGRAGAGGAGGLDGGGLDAGGLDAGAVGAGGLDAGAVGAGAVGAGAVGAGAEGEEEVAVGWRPREGRRVLWWVGAVLLVWALGVPVWRRVRGDVALYRGFFGTLQVKRYGEGEGAVVHLLDGRISHGFQRVARPEEPTAYFVASSGVGRVLSRPGPARVVEVVGLGAGTLAAYARAGDRFVFYEINPDVVTVAGRHFSFLRDAVARGAAVEVVVGDGRQAMAARGERGVDVVVLDAFSGDAIPAHLLTREAVALYRGRLAAEGVLLVNVANHHAELGRVVRGHAEALGWAWARVRGRSSSPVGPYFSDWMVLSARLPAGLPAAGVETGAGVVWTDDFAPLWPILRGW